MKKSVILLCLAFTLALSACSSTTNNPSMVSTKTTAGTQASGAQTPETSSTAPQSQTQNAIQYAFTQANQHPEKLLIDLIGSAKSSLDIAIYSLTNPDIVKAIKDAKKRGVTVRVITDKIQAAGKTQKEAMKLLANDNIPIKQNIHSGLMHLKVTIADQSVFTTGSYNYSAAATKENDEVLIKVNDATMAKDWDAQFERMWNDKKGFGPLQ